MLRLAPSPGLHDFFDSRPMTDIMSCNPCIRQGRECDQRRPVCDVCRHEEEIFCTWPTGRYVPTYTPAISSLLQDSRIQQLLVFDPELKELLSLVDRDDSSGQEALSMAIIIANIGDGSQRSNSEHIRRYNQGIHLINSAMNSPLWSDLAISVALANIYELYDLNNEVVNFCHLTGLQELLSQNLFRVSRPYDIPNTFVKSLIYHMAVAGTFSFSKFATGLPPFYISNLRAIMTGLEDQETEGDGPSSFLGLPLPLLDIMYQISHARHALQMPGGSNQGSRRLLRQCRANLQSADGLRSERPDGTYAPVENLEDSPLVGLFRAANLILVFKSLEPALASTSPGIRSIFSEAWEQLKTVPASQQHKAIVWPLVILYLAGLPPERDFIRSILREIRVSANNRRVGSILEFLGELEDIQSETSRDFVFDVLTQGDVDQLILL